MKLSVILLISTGLIPIDKTNDAELPSVLDQNVTGTRLDPPAQPVKGGHRSTGRPAVLKPISSSEQLHAPNQVVVTHQPTHRHGNLLSISGILNLL